MWIPLLVAFCWAIASILEKDLLRRVRREVLLIAMGTILVLINAISLAWVPSEELVFPARTDVYKIIILGAIGFYLSYTLFFMALKQDVPVIVLSLTNLTAIFAFFLMGMPSIGVRAGIGVVLSVVAAFLVS